MVTEDGNSPENASLIQPHIDYWQGRLVHVTQEDKGNRLNASRNRGIAAAATDFVIIIDGDMVPHPDFIKDYQQWMEPGFFIQPRRVRLGPQLTDRALKENKTLFPCWTSGIQRRIQSLRHPILAKLFSHREPTPAYSWRQLRLLDVDLEAINGFDMAYTSWGRNDIDTVARLLHNGVKRLYLRHAALAYHLYRETVKAQVLRIGPVSMRLPQKTRCQFGLNELDQVQ